MKKKNKRVVRYKSHINLNAGIVIFGLISIYLLINIVIYFTTERTAFYEVISGSNAQEANVSYNGIAIRNEIVQSAQDSGYIDYYVREIGIESIITESKEDAINLDLPDQVFIVPRGMDSPKQIAISQNVDAVVPLIGIDPPLIEVA